MTENLQAPIYLPFARRSNQLERETKPDCLLELSRSNCALSEATKETLNLGMLMQQLGFGSKKLTTIFCDNKWAIIMGLHPSNKATNRHIDMRKHLCGQRVELGNVITP